MKSYITGHILDDHLKIIELFHQEYSNSHEVLENYLLFVEKHRGQEEIQISHTIEKNAYLLVNVFTSLLDRSPEIGAYRHYLPKILWEEDQWTNLIQRFLNLPEFKNRRECKIETGTALPTELLSELITTSEKILINFTKIKDVNGKNLKLPAAIALKGNEAQSSLVILRDMLTIIHDLSTSIE